jgi:hypothetical protein
MSKTKHGEHNALPITAQEALELLQSAIGYLQMAGVTVQAQNSKTGLVLIIPGMFYSTNVDGTTAKFGIGIPPNDDSLTARLPDCRNGGFGKPYQPHR